MMDPKVARGRGTPDNPANRYELIHLEPDPEESEGDFPPTRFYRDASRSILAKNDSPDVGFRYSLNPYRGCEHGCVYCYARPSHEYLGFSAGLDFESRIMVKTEAPRLLYQALSSPRWQPQVVSLSGNTDCYQPVERRLQLTRRCLEVFLAFRNPVVIVTKSALVTRDCDLLAALAGFSAVQIFVSLTTLDKELARRMEPRAATPEKRLSTITTLAAHHIPVGAMIAPVIPGLNDQEIPCIVRQAKAAGAQSAAYTLVRLASPLDTLFSDWLAHHYPDRRARVLHRIRECRDGRLSDNQFGRRMRGQGFYAEQIRTLFTLSVRQAGLDQPLPPLSPAHFLRPTPLTESFV